MIPILVQHDADDDEDDDRDLPIAMAQGSLTSAIPRNAFGRPEEEITSDFPLSNVVPQNGHRAPRASEPPEPTEPLHPWEPLSDDEATGEALLSSLKKPGENASDDKPGPGRPGLN
jgi:hypothetical protein